MIHLTIVSSGFQTHSYTGTTVLLEDCQQVDQPERLIIASFINIEYKDILSIIAECGNVVYVPLTRDCMCSESHGNIDCSNGP